MTRHTTPSHAGLLQKCSTSLYHPAHSLSICYSFRLFWPSSSHRVENLLQLRDALLQLRLRRPLHRRGRGRPTVTTVTGAVVLRLNLSEGVTVNEPEHPPTWSKNHCGNRCSSVVIQQQGYNNNSNNNNRCSSVVIHQQQVSRNKLILQVSRKMLILQVWRNKLILPYKCGERCSFYECGEKCSSYKCGERS